MEAAYFYGPDKIPFRPDPEGGAADVAAPLRPFHGIISRGLLAQAVRLGLTPPTWHEYAHRLNQAGPPGTRPDLLTRLEAAARECEVLSVEQSARCAKTYLEQYLNGPGMAEGVGAELWNIKEGHTSSVWKASLSGPPGLPDASFIINVARDREAGLELKKASEKMQAIAQKCPGINAAGVYDIAGVELDYFDRLIKVVVTRNEWIADSYEIHRIAGPTKTRPEQYALVERFLTSENNPAHISSINGRLFSDAERRKIKRDVRFFLKNASKTAPVQVNINEGDVVWNGRRAVVVAIS